MSASFILERQLWGCDGSVRISDERFSFHTGQRDIVDLVMGSLECDRSSEGSRSGAGSWAAIPLCLQDIRQRRAPPIVAADWEGRVSRARGPMWQGSGISECPSTNQFAHCLPTGSPNSRARPRQSGPGRVTGHTPASLLQPTQRAATHTFARPECRMRRTPPERASIRSCG
jgi:hypothetical protein